MANDMQNVWQQAEHNSGALEELERMANNLRDRLTAAPGDKSAIQPAPNRVGLLGQLDQQAQTIFGIRDTLAALLDFVGERGVAPVPATAPPSKIFAGSALGGATLTPRTDRGY